MTYRPNRRDKVAWWLACQALRIATPAYRNFIDGAIRYGMAAAARDVVQGDSTPWCQRPECGLAWQRHSASHGPPPPGAVEGDFGPGGWKGLYCS